MSPFTINPTGRASCSRVGQANHLSRSMSRRHHEILLVQPPWPPRFRMHLPMIGSYNNVNKNAAAHTTCYVVVVPVAHHNLSSAAIIATLNKSSLYIYII
jgi:hypothetical protein